MPGLRSAPLTLVGVSGSLAGVAAAIRAAFLLSGALSVVIAALNAGRRKAAGPLRRRTGALLHCQHGLNELAAGHTLPVLVGKHTWNWKWATWSLTSKTWFPFS